MVNQLVSDLGQVVQDWSLIRLDVSILMPDLKVKIKFLLP